jgi:hypothetical protein
LGLGLGLGYISIPAVTAAIGSALTAGYLALLQVTRRKGETNISHHPNNGYSPKAKTLKTLKTLKTATYNNESV